MPQSWRAGCGEGWITYKSGRPYRVVAKDRTRSPIWEHRLMVERRLGRPLTSIELVHHHDDNTLNNEDKNLIVTTKEQHNIIHNRRRWKASWPQMNDIADGVVTKSLQKL